MVPELIDKYIWLLQTLIDAGERGLTLAQIERKWQSRYNAPYARRSFNNHREAIAEVFGIEILCNRQTNAYYVCGGRDALDRDTTRDWLINTFTVNNLLSLGKEKLSGRVAVEDIPSGHEYLTAAMSAMVEGKVLEITYQKYSGQSQEKLHVDPYALKEADRRWYLVAYCHERKGLRVYGMDRIKSLETSAMPFSMPEGFDVDRLFAESYGVYLSDSSQVRTITFRCDELQARFLRDLPIHHSQIELQTSKGFTTFAIRCAINEALVMEFCRHSSKIEVLQPQELRQRLADEARAMMEKYEKQI